MRISGAACLGRWEGFLVLIVVGLGHWGAACVCVCWRVLLFCW